MSEDKVWWPVSHVARHIIGCHPHWLYIEMERNRPAWARFLYPDGKRLLLDADAVADYVAEHPVDLPNYRSKWKRRGGKAHRKQADQ
ncbi:hypothetical protein [Streptomyces griseoluteus]|uniref:hypothetical protein n=1 Tax=Streptomyces griseoluteus TaxID=29306 RepID=UPI0034405E88